MIDKWMRNLKTGYIGKTSSMVDDACYDDFGYICDSTNGILWKPEAEEWCWFKNSKEIPSLRKLKEITGTNQYISYNENNAGSVLWNYCLPFIGRLPFK